MKYDRLNQRPKTAEEEIAEYGRRVDNQVSEIYTLEALGQSDAKAQQKLEVLLKTLEAAQQKQKALLKIINGDG
jgi:hypothetical protein